MEFLNSFLKWLGEHYPFLLWSIGLAAFIIWCTIKLNKLYRRLEDTEKECEKISGLEKDVHSGVSTLERIEDTLNKTLLPDIKKIGILEKNIHGLVAFLSTKHTDLQSGLFTTRSPLKLTDLGQQILEVTGGKKYVDENLDHLVAVMEKEHFKSGLDVQNYTTTLLIREYDSDKFVDIKNYIYKNPVYKTTDGKSMTLDLGVVNQVIGLYLRDKYFDKHPELNDIE